MNIFKTQLGVVHFITLRKYIRRKIVFIIQMLIYINIRLMLFIVFHNKYY